MRKTIVENKGDAFVEKFVDYVFAVVKTSQTSHEVGWIRFWDICFCCGVAFSLLRHEHL